ncbi:DUF3319 domain-containing protein [Vibrio sp. TH_r3]|uniref:DUF3319 domain-containing protein n=1 Tax=Vibrio sp. TH_r3 TaxID=3082084 RepID=UPI002953CA5A|nr:DUF3319 domain-containing protein [Vibrio sp. TH_r3]MDV7103516.1 DUF3319 domain-containing protein [Vibrio sp. TH_r3]
MATKFHRGYCLQSGSGKDLWHVRIKKQILSGELSAVKKSIDWWCDTATIIQPSEFSSLAPPKGEVSNEQQEEYNGELLKSDSGDKNSWYCFFNGKLVKGSKEAIKKHIDKHLAVAAKRNK